MDFIAGSPLGPNGDNICDFLDAVKAEAWPECWELRFAWYNLLPSLEISTCVEGCSFGGVVFQTCQQPNSDVLMETAFNVFQQDWWGNDRIGNGGTAAADAAGICYVKDLMLGTQNSCSEPGECEEFVVHTNCGLKDCCGSHPIPLGEVPIFPCTP